MLHPECNTVQHVAIEHTPKLVTDLIKINSYAHLYSAENLAEDISPECNISVKIAAFARKYVRDADVIR